MVEKIISFLFKSEKKISPEMEEIIREEKVRKILYSEFHCKRKLDINSFGYSKDNQQ